MVGRWHWPPTGSPGRLRLFPRAGARMAMALADAGHTDDALTLAARLPGIGSVPDRPATTKELREAAELVVVRLWASWAEHRTDHVALARASSLITLTDPALDPRLRAQLHAWVGAVLLYDAGPLSPAGLAECQEHLVAALSLARSLGERALEIDALTWLGLLTASGPNMVAAAEAALSARERADELEASQPAHGRADYWQFMAHVVLFWTGYFQGRPLDADAVHCLEQGLQTFPHDPVLRSAAGTVLVAAVARAGDVPRARGIARAMLADRPSRHLGGWGVRLLVSDGYLAVVSGDAHRVRHVVNELARRAAHGEALTLRAMQCAAAQDPRAGLTILAPVTSGQVPTSGVTLAVACALQAVLQEKTGDHPAADRTMRQALGAAEPFNARRLFAVIDNATMLVLVRRAREARPHGGFADEVFCYLREEVARVSDRGPVARCPVDSLRERFTEPVGAVGTPGAARPVPHDPVTMIASPLTGRECQVLALVSQGASQQQIASELFVSLNTVKTHLRSIRTKLGVDRTGQAAALARSAGWIPS